MQFIVATHITAFSFSCPVSEDRAGHGSSLNFYLARPASRPLSARQELSMQPPSGRCARCLAPLDCGETACSFCRSVAAGSASSGSSALPSGLQPYLSPAFALPSHSVSVVQRRPLLSLSSSTCPTLTTYNKLPIVPSAPSATPSILRSLTHRHTSTTATVKRARTSPTPSARTLKRSRSLATKPCSREERPVTRTSSLKNIAAKKKSVVSQRASTSLTDIRASTAPTSVTGTQPTKPARQRTAKHPPPQIPFTMQPTHSAAEMGTRVAVAQTSTTTSSAPHVSPIYTAPVTVSSLASQLTLSSATTMTQSIACSSTPTPPQAPSPQPPNDISNFLLLARLDQLEARLDARDSRLISHINERFNQFTARQERIEAAQGELSMSHQTMRGDHDRRIADLTERVDALQQSTPPPSDQPAYHDEHEVRFGGLPAAAGVTVQTAERLLQALELDRLCPHVIGVREWRSRRPGDASVAAGGSTAVTMVLRFSCAALRDEAALAYRRASGVSLSRLFGVQEADQLTITAILPPPVFRLLRAAQRRSRELNYLNPIRRGLQIYMRPARGVPPILVNSIDALDRLQPVRRTATNGPPVTSDSTLLSEMSKILERVIHTQLITYLIDHDLLSPHQHGFRPSHSTHTATLDITERVRSAIDERMVSVLVSFDFSKAFDTIPHRRLLVWLREIGCDDLTIRWFVDYLSLRNLAVRNADGSHSQLYNTTSGVPQGSVLGPLLFLIYILPPLHPFPLSCHLCRRYTNHFSSPTVPVQRFGVSPGSDRITISRSPRRGLTRLAIDGAQHSHDEVRSENHTHKRAPDAGAKAQLERMMAPEARTTLTR
ncbi:unnamed protein product [Trichogramma brassicae]|uniref:Reverse transcriptase domain-containing protein n=1 Tax=Trichogramma brassicae TaxID=86971 RepID=A0A6H5J0U8_9HYME|nr:unnamed protein product [Trichogramma brassicae]